MIKPQTIDLTEADGYAVTDADLVIKKLKHDKLYKSDLMYRGFDGKKLKIMLEHGTDTPDLDTIFCGNESELIEGGTTSAMNALEYAYRHSNPALAIYDGSKLMGGYIHSEKRFIDPQKKLEALIAVYLLPEAEL